MNIVPDSAFPLANPGQMPCECPLKEAMTKKNGKNLGISELLVGSETRPIEYMLSEYRREMEEIKKALKNARGGKKPVKSEGKKRRGRNPNSAPENK